MSRLRLVIDTNVFISALLSKRSNPFLVVNFAFNYHILLTSNDTLAELQDVLFRKKFDKYVTTQERQIFLKKFMNTTERVEIIQHFDDCRDPKDNCFLDLGVNGKADFIITGDKDLLVLNPFQEIEIITPDIFIYRFVKVEE